MQLLERLVALALPFTLNLKDLVGGLGKGEMKEAICYSGQSKNLTR